MSWYELSNVRIHERALDSMLHSPAGDVGRHMRRIGLQILGGARVLVPRRTGRLARSLYMNQARTVRGQYVQVGSDVNYAFVQHEGERPHMIEAHQGRILRFTNNGQVVYARRTHHPGFRGTKYLTIPMRRAVR